MRMTLVVLGTLALLALPLASLASAQAMSGTYTVNNGGSSDFDDLGQAFTAVMLNGLSGNTTIEVYDDGGPYTATATYRLNTFNNAGGTHSLTVTAAPGESPIIQGSGATSPFSGTGTLILNAVTNVTIEGLRITGGVTFGIQWYNSHNVTIRRCIVYNCFGAGIFGYGNSIMSGCTVTACVVYDCPGGTSSTVGQAALAFRRAANDTVVTHNTVVRTSGGSMSVGVICNNGTSNRFEELSNNIFYNTSPNTIAYGTDASGVVAALRADGNCFYLGTNTAFSNMHWPTYTDWTNAGYDANGINQDPEFISVTAPVDFQLHATSPCIAAGITGLPATSSSVDAEGNPFGTPPTIGAYESINPPVVTGVSASSADWLDAVTIDGTDLNNAIEVRIGGTEASIVNNTSTSIDIVVADGTPTGMQTIEVETPGGIDNAFTIDISAILATVAGVNPQPVEWLEHLTIDGTAMLTTTEVLISGVPVPIMSVASTQLVVEVPDTIGSGMLDLEIVNQAGTNAPTAIAVHPKIPVLTGTQPAAATWLETLTIGGLALATASKVTIGGVESAIDVSSTNSVTILVSDETPLGSQPLVVTTDGGESNALTVTVAGTAPIVTEVEPAPVRRGQMLTIQGLALTDATVTVGGADVMIESNTAHEIVVHITTLVPLNEQVIEVTTQFGTDSSMSVVVLAPLESGSSCAAVDANGSRLGLALTFALLALTLGMARRRLP